MDYMQKIFKKSSNLVDRIIDDEVIIVPIKADLSKDGAVYNLDPMGARIWQMINGNDSLSRIKEHILETTDACADQAEKDLIEFFKDLESAGAIEEAC